MLGNHVKKIDFETSKLLCSKNNKKNLKYNFWDSTSRSCILSLSIYTGKNHWKIFLSKWEKVHMTIKILIFLKYFEKYRFSQY